MPNSKPVVYKVETVRPDNGQHENRWVAILVVVVVLIASVGIQWRQSDRALVALPQLGTLEQQIWVELAIAAEEIDFLYPDAPWPAVSELQSQGIAPFNREDVRWRLIGQDCYLSEASGTVSGRFLMRRAEPYEIGYQHQLDTAPSLCEPLANVDHWQRLQ